MIKSINSIGIIQKTINAMIKMLSLPTQLLLLFYFLKYLSLSSITCKILNNVTMKTHKPQGYVAIWKAKILLNYDVKRKCRSFIKWQPINYEMHVIDLRIYMKC